MLTHIGTVDFSCEIASAKQICIDHRTEKVALFKYLRMDA